MKEIMLMIKFVLPVNAWSQKDAQYVKANGSVMTKIINVYFQDEIEHIQFLWIILLKFTRTITIITDLAFYRRIINWDGKCIALLNVVNY